MTGMRTRIVTIVPSAALLLAMTSGAVAAEPNDTEPVGGGDTTEIVATTTEAPEDEEIVVTATSTPADHEDEDDEDERGIATTTTAADDEEHGGDGLGSVERTMLFSATSTGIDAMWFEAIGNADCTVTLNFSNPTNAWYAARGHIGEPREEATVVTPWANATPNTPVFERNVVGYQFELEPVLSTRVVAVNQAARTADSLTIVMSMDGGPEADHRAVFGTHEVTVTGCVPPPTPATCPSTATHTITSLSAISGSDAPDDGWEAELVPGAIELEVDSTSQWVRSLTAVDTDRIGNLIDVQWSGTGTPPSVALYVYDGDTYMGGLVGEPAAYGQTYWTSESGALRNYAPVQGGSGNGSPYFGTLDAWQGVLEREGFRIRLVGFNLGSGNISAGTLTSVTGACTTIKFDVPPPPTADPACAADPQVVTVTDVSQFSWTDIRSTGHFELIPGAAEVWTEGATSTDKVAGYVTAPSAKLGTDFGIEWDGVGTPPSVQIVLDDGSILVWEGAYGGALWATASSPIAAHAPRVGDGHGSQFYGWPDEWQAVMNTLGRTVKEVGFSLGSGVHASGELREVRAGCTTLRFDVPPPVETTEAPTETTEAPTETTEVPTETTEAPADGIAAAVTQPRVQRGAQQIGTARGFVPGEVVTGTMNSSPLALGTQVADVNGEVNFRWTIPADAELGAHSFVVVGATSGTASAGFEVIAEAELPTTGTDISSNMLLIAAAAVAGGLGLLVAVRRRQA